MSPTSSNPGLEDAEDAYLRALQQLSTLQVGRYAYAQDWNVLADYAKVLVDILADAFERMLEKGYRHYIDPYEKLLECRRILSMYRHLKTGDVIMPEHTNTLIDVVRCLDEVVALLPFPKEIVMVDTDDWDTAKRYVSDGTIIFINYGIQTATPEEVRKIVDTYRVVFAVMIDTQPFYRRDTGAFYGVFYRERNPGDCRELTGCFNIVDGRFVREFGFTSCSALYCDGFGRIWTLIDYAVHETYKVEHAKAWAVGPCGYSYARYSAGSIIEVPSDGVWRDTYTLDIYIGMLSRILLDDEHCYVASRGKKLHRIIWMAYYTSTLPQYHECHPADRCLAELASRSDWRLIDLRKK